MSRSVYPKYKPSGVEWLGDVPEHWEVKRLKYAASINDEALAETTDPGYEFSYVDIGNVDAVQGIVAKETYIFENAPSRARRIVRDGDTIVSTVRTYLRAIAPICEPDDHLIVSTGFAVVRPRKTLPKYLSYALQSPYFIDTVVSRSTGVSYPAINAPEVGTIAVPIPAHDEQRTIAAFLDRETTRIDTLIEKKQRQIELLQEKRAALISHAVTKGLDLNARMKDSGIEWMGKIPEHWEIKRLRHVMRCLDGRRIPLNAQQRGEMQGEYPYWEANGIVDHLNGWLFDEPLVLLGEDGAPFFEASKDVAFFVTGKVWINNHIHVLRPVSTIDPVYLTHSLNLTDYGAFIEGTTRDKLTQDKMKDIPVFFPSFPEQRAIADYLDHETARIDALIGNVRKSINLLREYRTALISAAVTGKIDVRKEVAA